MWKLWYICSMFVVLLCVHAPAASASLVNVDQERLSRISYLAGFDAYAYAWRNGNYEEARSALDDLIYSYPDETYLYYLRSLTFIIAKDFEGARADSACYSEYEPDDMEGYKLNTYVCYESKAYEDAMYYCRRGLEINPDNTYLLKYEQALEALIAEERKRESFEHIGMGEEDYCMREILDFVNEKRQSAGLGGLDMNALLNQAAKVRAGELVRSFSNTRPDGSPYLSVLREFEIPYHFAGALIYKGAGTPEETVAEWKRIYAKRDFGMDLDTRYLGIGFAEENGVTYLALLFIL